MPPYLGPVSERLRRRTPFSGAFMLAGGCEAVTRTTRRADSSLAALGRFKYFYDGGIFEGSAAVLRSLALAAACPDERRAPHGNRGAVVPRGRQRLGRRRGWTLARGTWTWSDRGIAGGAVEFMIKSLHHRKRSYHFPRVRGHLGPAFVECDRGDRGARLADIRRRTARTARRRGR